jgi:hypothetical protein
MARASTGVITGSEGPPADLGTFLMFDHEIHVGILAITSSTSAWTTMTTS